MRNRVPEHSQVGSTRIVDCGLEKMTGLVSVLDKVARNEELTEEERALCKNSSDTFAAVFSVICQAQVKMICGSCRTLNEVSQLISATDVFN